MSVNAVVRYLNDEWKARSERPFIYSKATRHRNTTRREVAIADARSLAAGEIAIDDNGFTLVDHETAIADYSDNEAIRASYATELVPLLRRATGAREVFVQGHQMRTESPATFLGAYSRYVHCDYPMAPQPNREASILQKHGSPLAACVGKLDYAWFNIWEAIERPAEQNQLTVIDASTMADDDFQEYYFTPSASGGYAAIPTWNPAHRFYYFSNMQPGEAILFKQYDSRPGQPKVCPHTAFYDPAVGDDHAPRRSMEYRALCVF